MTPLLSSALLRAQTDDRLAALAAAGHDRAFEAIVERYRRPLQRYLRRLLSETLAEDVLQATFLSAWSSLRGGTQVRDLRPWLYRIAHNAAINSLKKVGEAMEEIPESAGGFATEPELELERRDEMRQALTIIAALPSRQRTALLAVAVDGRAHSDVAAELGLTDGAVRQLVHRARNTLRTTATAMTPAPLLHWMLASAGDSTIQRVVEVTAGAGAAGAASMSLKAGAAVVIATGVLATGGTEVAKVVPPENAAEPAAAPQIAPAVSPSSGPGGGASFASTTIAAPAARGPAPAAPGATTTPSTNSGRGHAGRRGHGHGRGRAVKPSRSSTHRAGGEAPAPTDQGLARRPAGAVATTSPNRGPGSVAANGGSGAGVGAPTSQPAHDGGAGNSGPGGGGASGQTPSTSFSSGGKGVKGGGSGTSGPGPSGSATSGAATSGKGVSGGGGTATAKTATAPAPEPAPQPDPIDGMKGGGIGGMRNMG
ncbi:MAG: hypothetical protein QOD44_2637, partial [Solirubrobacteraceae bacterium]|nr:hypothetical protein [Solirubrobacteraceae bacterium]